MFLLRLIYASRRPIWDFSLKQLDAVLEHSLPHNRSPHSTMSGAGALGMLQELEQSIPTF